MSKLLLRKIKITLLEKELGLETWIYWVKHFLKAYQVKDNFSILVFLYQKTKGDHLEFQARLCF